LFILGIDKWIIGDHGDAWQFIWNFWWVKKAILERRNIFYTDYLFYPHGTHLYFHTLNLAGIFMVFPLLFLIENLILVYNIAVLLTFILSGYFMYLFLHYFLGGDKKRKRIDWTKEIICFLGGCMYAFSPYVVLKALGYFNLLSVQWFPLVLLFTFKILNEKSFKNTFILSVLLVILFFADFHYFYYYFIFAGFYLLFSVTKIKPEGFLNFALAILASSLVLFLVYSPAFSMYKANRSGYVRDYFQTITAYNYFLASPFTMVYKIFPRDLLSLYFLSENYNMLIDSIVYYGIGYLTLLAASVFIQRNKLHKVGFLLALLVFSSMIALGNSTPVSLKMNDLLRGILPFFDLLPVPARHSFLGLLSLVLLTSFFAYNFVIKLKGRVFFLFLLTLIFMIEYFPLNYSSYYHVDTPRAIDELATSNENVSILNIPHMGNTQGMYFQTIHGKKILDGFVSRHDPKSAIILNKLYEAINECNKWQIKKIFEELKTRYIIVNHNYGEDYNFSLNKVFKCLQNWELKETIQNTKIFELFIPD